MSVMNVSVGELHGDLAKPTTFAVEDVFWGYTIRSGRGPSFGVALGQALSFFFGVCFATAALGILILPTLFFDGELGAMRVGSAALFGAVAAYLLWFASRGTKAEVQVDTSIGEIREVICNRAGTPTIVGSYGFDEIGGVFVEEDELSGQAQLILRYRTTSQSVFIAEGTEAQLRPLRDRLAHNLLG